MHAPEFLERIRDSLRSRRSELLRELDGDVLELRNQFAGEDVCGDEDPDIDSCQDHLASSLAEHTSEEILLIDEALKRLRDRTYGNCESCGRVIARGRLLAVPLTSRCVTCQSGMESRRKPA